MICKLQSKFLARVCCIHTTYSVVYCKPLLTTCAKSVPVYPEKSHKGVNNSTSKRRKEDSMRSRLCVYDLPILSILATFSSFFISLFSSSTCSSPCWWTRAILKPSLSTGLQQRVLKIGPVPYVCQKSDF